MGDGGKVRTDEDEQCALYMRNLLEGRRPDPDAVRSLVMACDQAAKYDDPARPHFRPEDRETALKIDSIPFAIKVSREDGMLVSRPVGPRFIRTSAISAPSAVNLLQDRYNTPTMCGRYSLIADLGELARRFEFDGDWDDFDRRYNIAPTQDVLTVVGGESRRGGYMRWGLIPFWAKDKSIGSRMD